MADENSFDIVSKIDLAEVDNAINQTRKEVATRYDLKGSFCTIERADRVVALVAEDKFKLRSVDEILRQKLAKRGVPLKGLAFSEPAAAAGGRVSQTIDVQNGIPTDKARDIAKAIKDLKLKVQASIQGDQLRVKGTKKDDLQAVIRHLREKDFGIDMQFTNYR
ncbi:MAG TPA: YajQ family cyclic di-GMP-binding protein [Candidatus Polarisedimenticolia bacterium]|nr:YajQ family cyclic di-GMP-binding protein [Candidatus Polarisedimenticolia bacterium]